MSCIAVRDRLTEHALGVLPSHEASTVDRHLEWCAACRKEVGELQRAAATLAFSVAPVEPPAELEGAVVETVRRAAKGGAASPRRSRVAAATLLAAVLALSGLGWGAVMAGRAGRYEERAQQAIKAQHVAFEKFRDVIEQAELADPENIVELADLTSPRLRTGAGQALVLLSPSTDDLVFVVVAGMTDVREGRLPLEVRLVSDDAGELVVGKISALDAGGGGGVSRWFVENLNAFDALVIRDARGKVLLNGSLGVHQPPA